MGNATRTRLLSPGEAAARLGITPDTLAVWSARIRALKRAVVRTDRKAHRRYREDRIEAYRAALLKKASA